MAQLSAEVGAVADEPCVAVDVLRAVTLVLLTEPGAGYHRRSAAEILFETYQILVVKICPTFTYKFIMSNLRKCFMVSYFL